MRRAPGACVPPALRAGAISRPLRGRRLTAAAFFFLLPIPSPSQATFGLGFVLACVYHICQMDEDGLAAASVLGVPGPVWR